MARKWSGFLPQNLNEKEEWELLESVRAVIVEREQSRKQYGNVCPVKESPKPEARVPRATKVK